MGAGDAASAVLAERGRIWGGGLGEGDGPDRWAAPVSRQRERGKGAWGLGQNGRKEGGGISFPFIFFYTKFPIEILSRKRK